MKYLLLLSLFLLLPSVAQAQKVAPDGMTNNPPQTPVDTEALNSEPLSNTHSITGQIVQVFEPDNALTIVDRNGKRFHLVLNNKTRLRADKQTELADRKQLSLTDFKPGHTVKITYFAQGGGVTEVRLRRTKS
jgi:hypothetical protein